MKENKFFKKSLFGGFKRKDVLSYIEELHQKLMDNEVEIAQLKEANAQLSSEYNILSKEIEESTKAQEELTENNQALTQQVHDTQNEIITLQNKVISLEELNRSLNENSFASPMFQPNQMRFVDEGTYHVVQHSLLKIDELSLQLQQEISNLKEETNIYTENQAKANKESQPFVREDSAFNETFSKLKSILSHNVSNVQKNNISVIPINEMPKENVSDMVQEPDLSAANQKFTVDFDKLGAFFTEEQIENFKKHQSQQN